MLLEEKQRFKLRALMSREFTTHLYLKFLHTTMILRYK